MATIKEILDRIEVQNAEQIQALLDNMALIIANTNEKLDCITGRINDLAYLAGCDGFADIVVVADRSEQVGADEVYVEAWLQYMFNDINVENDGVHGSIYMYPKSPSDGTTLNNTVESQGLTGSNTLLIVAADSYLSEVLPSDGRRPVDQAIVAASTELLARGRAGSRKVIIVLMTGPSNFHDGYGTVATDPVIHADNARAAGYELYVVTVGATVNPGEAAAIAGGADRVFHSVDYENLHVTIDQLKTALCGDSSSFVACDIDDPELTAIPELELCGSNNCCDEL